MGMRLFWIEMVNEKNSKGEFVRCVKTVQGYMQTARRHGIHLSTMRGARARIEEAAFTGGLGVIALEDAPLAMHEAIATYTAAIPIIHPQGDLVMRMACYLLLATGCRAEHLGRMRSVRVGSQGIHVLWGPRKVRQLMNREVFYDWEWSFPPPSDLGQFLSAWPVLRTRLVYSPTGRFVTANRVNLFISRIVENRPAGLTSSYYRRRLSTILGHYVVQGRMMEAVFAELMDHTVETGRSCYMLNGDANNLMY